MLKSAYITVPTPEQAEIIAQRLVEQGLVACANIFPAITSLYEWEGKIAKESETVIIAKTTQNQEQAIIDLVKKNHPYDCPCIVFHPIQGGNNEYLNWVEKQVK